MCVKGPGLKYRAFFGGDVAIAQEGGQRRREHDHGHGSGDTVGHGLGADIDHRGLTLGVEVGKHSVARSLPSIVPA